METQKTDLEKSQLFCTKHKKQIQFLNLLNDNKQKLACNKCFLENKLEHDYTIEIEQILNQEEKTIFKQLPIGLDDDIYEYLINLKEQKIQNKTREQLNEELDLLFKKYAEAIFTELNNHKKLLIIHLNSINDQTLNTINSYNTISSKKEVLEFILQCENDPILLDQQLKEFVEKKYDQSLNDNQIIQDEVDKLKYLVNQFDLKFVEDNLKNIFQNIASSRMIKNLKEVMEIQKQEQEQLEKKFQDQIEKQIEGLQLRFQQQQQQYNVEYEKLSQLQNSFYEQQQKSFFISQNDDLLSQSYFLQQDEQFQQNQYQQQQQLYLNNQQQQHPQQVYQHQYQQQQQLRQQSFYSQPYQQKYSLHQQKEQDITVFLESQQNTVQIIKSIEELTYIPNLHQYQQIRIELQSQQLDDYNMKQLNEILKQCKSLDRLYLNLGNNRISDKGINNLTQCLQQLSQLKEIRLYLSKNYFGLMGLQCLTQTLEYYPNLTILDLQLSDNNIRGDHLSTVIELISTQQNLTKLSLGLNATIPGRTIMLDLSECIGSLQYLDELKLNLDKNSLVDDDIKSISEAILYISSKLKFLKLQLEGNQITNLSVQYLLNSISACYNLQEVSLFFKYNLSIKNNGMKLLSSFENKIQLSCKKIKIIKVSF